MTEYVAYPTATGIRFRDLIDLGFHAVDGLIERQTNAKDDAVGFFEFSESFLRKAVTLESYLV